MLKVDVDCGVVCLFGEKGCEGGNGTCEDCVDIIDYINDDVYWEDAKRLRSSMKNPWLTIAIERITERGNMWKQEFIQTVMEYNGADEHYGNPACPECGRKMWYRSTVGTVVCPSCHHVRRS